MKRLDEWKKQWRIPVGIIDPDDELLQLARQRWRKRKKRKKGEEPGLLWGIIQAAKELIFDIENDKPVFHVVMFELDAKTFELVVAPMLDIIELDTKDQIKLILAMAMALDVPVYPNTDDIAPVLVGYHKDLLIHGFKSKDESGKESHLVVTKFRDIDIESFEFVEKIKSQQMLSPAELLIMKEAVIKEMREREEAGRILASLRSAIIELSELLEATRLGESDLQNCLTRNPILFGTEYRRVIPKHRLGAEYEMDYALERISGLVDLVEIEASTHPLYTKRGQPSQHLVHAEQQVLDWLNWVEKHSSYARESLPGIQRPVGYIIIGRSASLSPVDQERLVCRNAVLRGTLQIMTYDDLLQRAKNLLNLLKGK